MLNKNPIEEIVCYKSIPVNVILAYIISIIVSLLLDIWAKSEWNIYTINPIHY